MKTYEDGLNEAWEVARKLLCDNGYNYIKLEDIFDSHSLDGIFSTYTASEAIDRIKKYESERFNVGDEVTDWNGKKGVITWISPDCECLIVVVLESGTAIRWKKTEFKKTGRHFPQIVEVLKQMQEGEKNDIRGIY